MSTLTGRTRYRSKTNWRGKEQLILQVEYSNFHMKDLNGSGYYDEWTTMHWRDAQTIDFPSTPQVPA